MRSECRFCGVALTKETRARGSFTLRSGRQNWCVACDTPDAPVRARRQSNQNRDREKLAAAQRRYRQSEKGKRQRQQARAAKRWRDGVTFRCAGCHGRFANSRESWRLVDGLRKRLGLCRYCAESRVGPSKHDGPLWQQAKRERVRKARALSAAA